MSQPYPETRPFFSRVLWSARELLRERGWTASVDKCTSPFLVARDNGTGPLTLTRALWAGARWGEEGRLVDPSAAGKACKALCVVLWGQQAVADDYGFVELGRWCSAPGRTQEEVIRLIDRAGRACVKAIETFCAEAEIAGGDDVPCPVCGQIANPLWIAKNGRCRECSGSEALP